MNRVFVFFTLITFFAMTDFLQAQTKFVMSGLSHGHSHWIFQKSFQGDFELVGVHEDNKELIASFIKNYQLDESLFFASMEEMLDKTDADGVLAFGPVSQHLNVVKAAAVRGIHVMVEKPLAFRASEAEEIQTLAEQHNIHVLTNYETSWYPSTDALSFKLRSEEEAFGTIRKAVFHHGHKGPQEIGVGKEFFDWLTDPKQNGAGALVDFGCYGANIMTFLVDGQVPLSVTAVTQTHKPDIYKRVDDEATIILTYPGVQAIIQASWNWPFDRKDMQVYTENGYLLTMDKESLYSRVGQEKEETVQFLSKEMTGTETNPFQYFAEVIQGELQVPPYGLYSLENNILVARILEAAIESAESGKTVYFEK